MLQNTRGGNLEPTAVGLSLGSSQEAVLWSSEHRACQECRGSNPRKHKMLCEKKVQNSFLSPLVSDASLSFIRINWLSVGYSNKNISNSPALTLTSLLTYSL